MLGDLARRRQRLELLKARAAKKGFVFAPKRVHAANLARLQALGRELQSFPTSRQLLKRREFESTLTLFDNRRALIHKVQDSAHRYREERYLPRIAR